MGCCQARTPIALVALLLSPSLEDCSSSHVGALVGDESVRRSALSTLVCHSCAMTTRRVEWDFLEKQAREATMAAALLCTQQHITLVARFHNLRRYTIGTMRSILLLLRTRPVVALLVVVTTTAAVVRAGSNPVRNLHVTLRGKKYDIEDGVTTVAELQERVQDASGSSSSAQQHSVLFGGKRLEPTDVLSDVGVSDGSQLDMIPAAAKPATKSSSTKKKSASSSSGTNKKSSKKKATSTTVASAGADASASASNPMKDYLKEAGVDTDKLEEMVKKGMAAGGGGGAGGEEMPSMKESMDMMSSMMNSPIFQEYMSDPAKLEESRQMILNNPMLKSMMAGMPGMEDILNDPEAWREAMQAAANMYKSMDQDQLMQMMSGAGGAMPGGMPGSAGGLFDGGTLGQQQPPSAAAAATTAALDELDED